MALTLQKGFVMKQILFRYNEKDSLAANLNWIGSGKNSIQEFIIILLLISDAVCKNREFSTTSRASNEDSTKHSLRTAKDRDGGRNKQTMKALP